MDSSLNKLKDVIGNYHFFWDEWTCSCYCTLSEKEIQIINYYIKVNFQLQASDPVQKYKQLELLNSIVKKLEIGYQVFTHFVVTEFLHSLVKLAKNNSSGFVAFLNSPIVDLDLSPALKESLSKFKVDTISVLCGFYKPHELSSGLLYKHVVDFQIINQKEKIMT